MPMLREELSESPPRQRACNGAKCRCACSPPAAATTARPTPATGTSAGGDTQAPAVVLLGGEANALSVARELGRQGVKVYALGTEHTCVRHSRYCEWIELPQSVAAGASAEDRLTQFLLGREGEPFRGALLLACSDAAITVLATNRAALLERYRLELANPPAQLAMLDKLRTYEIAREAGVATPKFWAVSTGREVEAIREQLVFPLMIKPRLSHVFERHFGRKHMTVGGYDELVGVFDGVAGAGIDVMLVEVIPGPDDQLASYFTYIDAEGRPLCHYTKRVIRRYPSGMGATCYHVTGDVPEIIEPSLRLLARAGVLGLANLEFKLDRRDGQYKLIECNARFVASNALVAESGPRLATFVYARASGRPATIMTTPARVRRQWDPLRDFAAFRELRRAGELTTMQWLRSISHRQSFPYFTWTDPGPTLSRLLKGGRRALLGKAKG